MPAYSKGDVVIVLYPFTDGVGRKPRPAAVVSSATINASSRDLVLALITSNVAGAPGPGDFDLTDRKAANLLAPSRLRATRLATVELAKVRKIMGSLVPGDLTLLDQNLRLVLDL